MNEPKPKLKKERNMRSIIGKQLLKYKNQRHVNPEKITCGLCE